MIDSRRRPRFAKISNTNRGKRLASSDFLTANEGDAREYGEEDTAEFFTDETRVEDLAIELGLDATMAPYNDDTLGRLKVGLSILLPLLSTDTWTIVCMWRKGCEGLPNLGYGESALPTPLTSTPMVDRHF